MGFRTAVRTCLRKWITFSGRAPRSEYWWFALFQILFYGLTMAITLLILGTSTISPAVSVIANGALLVWSLVIGVLLVWLFLASVSAVVRRLHDRDLSGWWYGGYCALFLAVGIVGTTIGEDSLLRPIAAGLLPLAMLALLVALVLRGTRGRNRYGGDPLSAADPAGFD